MNKKPVIGVLLGDPTGIGPEIIAKLLTRTELYGLASIVIFPCTMTRVRLRRRYWDLTKG